MPLRGLEPEASTEPLGDQLDRPRMQTATYLLGMGLGERRPHLGFGIELPVEAGTKRTQATSMRLPPEREALLAGWTAEMPVLVDEFSANALDLATKNEARRP
jgi:hypothetical protein